MTNSFPAEEFLQYQTGTYNKTTSKVSLSNPGGADFYNLKGTDSRDGYWNIWFANPDQEIDLDALRTSTETTPYYDRDWEVDIQAIKLGNGYSGNRPANFNDLFRFNGTNLDKMNYFIGAWSSVTCAQKKRAYLLPPV